MSRTRWMKLAPFLAILQALLSERTLEDVLEESWCSAFVD